MNKCRDVGLGRIPGSCLVRHAAEPYQLRVPGRPDAGRVEPQLDDRTSSLMLGPEGGTDAPGPTIEFLMSRRTEQEVVGLFHCHVGYIGVVPKPAIERLDVSFLLRYRCAGVPIQYSNRLTRGISVFHALLWFLPEARQGEKCRCETPLHRGSSWMVGCCEGLDFLVSSDYNDPGAARSVETFFAIASA